PQNDENTRFRLAQQRVAAARGSQRAFLTTLDLSFMAPKPGTVASMSWPSIGSMRRIPRTLVPTLTTPPPPPLILGSWETVTVTASARTLPTESRISGGASSPSPPSATPAVSGDHSWPHIGHASSRPDS